MSTIEIFKYNRHYGIQKYVHVLNFLFPYFAFDTTMEIKKVIWKLKVVLIFVKKIFIFSKIFYTSIFSFLPIYYLLFRNQSFQHVINLIILHLQLCNADLPLAWWIFFCIRYFPILSRNSLQLNIKRFQGMTPESEKLQ